jgi:membrane protease YdiL (CAAX protease family)
MSTQEITSMNNVKVLSTSKNDQYTVWQILGIWASVSLPMALLAWVVYPALSQGLPAVDRGLLWMKLSLLGLIWQFVFSMLILHWEEGNIRLATISRRFWLNNPVSPRTGQKDNRLWWLLIPLMLLVVILELGLAPFLDGIWTNLFPFLSEPQSRSLDALFVPEMRALWIGAWNFFALFVISSLFSNFLSEEFLFRGVLLPKMHGSFGRWDWVANGFLFGVYHLHMPWTIPGNIVFGWLMAFTSKRYRSNWFPIVLHNGQAFYFGFLILGLVLGLA